MHETPEKIKPNIIQEDTLELASKAHQKFLLTGNGEDLKCAIDYYIDTIRVKPEISKTYYRLASLMHETGQISVQGAVEQCRQAVLMDSNNPDAHMYLGYFLALEGNKDAAKDEFQTAIKLKPLASARARLIMAIMLLEDKKNYRNNLFEALYCLFSGSALFLINKGGLKMLFKNIVNDINYLRYKIEGSFYEGVNNDKRAYKTYCDAIDNSKNKEVFYKKMANIAIKRNDLIVAHKCLQNAVQVSNENPECVVDAIEFTEKNFPQNYDELIDYYKNLLKSNPDFSRCYYELGHVYFRKNEPLNALNSFKLALEHDENNPLYLNSLAFAYVQLEQYDDAIELYKKALENNSNSEWASIVAQALAVIYHQIKGNYEAAISMFQNALLLSNNKGQIYQNLADVYYDMNNMDEALKYYKISLKENENDPKIYSRLGMIYWECDKIEEAISYYLKAIDKDPDYDIAYNNLGVVLLDGLNDANRAIPYFETAIDINAGYVLAYFNCARAYQLLGKNIEAAKMYQNALNFNKNSHEIDDGIIEEKLYGLFDI